jgi:hypothetical protein
MSIFALNVVFVESVDEFIKSINLEKSNEIVYRNVHDSGVIDIIYREYKSDIALSADIIAFTDGKTELAFSMPLKNIGLSINPHYIAQSVHEYLAECYKIADLLGKVRIQNSDLSF